MASNGCEERKPRSRKTARRYLRENLQRPGDGLDLEALDLVAFAQVLVVGE